MPPARFIRQADCYNGLNPLFERTKKQMPVAPTFCFANERRKISELADVSRRARHPPTGTADPAFDSADRTIQLKRDIVAGGSVSG
jgi:hypothetical protein